MYAPEGVGGPSAVQIELSDVGVGCPLQQSQLAITFLTKTDQGVSKATPSMATFWPSRGWPSNSCQVNMQTSNENVKRKVEQSSVLYQFIMLSPKRTKFRKQQRGRMKGKALRGNTIAFGDFALQALEPCWITSRQIEAGRRAMTRYARRGGKLWIRIFPDKPVTMRAADTRMGSGKGSPEYWVAVIKPGKILYEMRGVSESIARTAMKNASHKMPVKTQFLMKKLGPL